MFIKNYIILNGYIKTISFLFCMVAYTVYSTESFIKDFRKLDRSIQQHMIKKFNNSHKIRF